MANGLTSLMSGTILYEVKAIWSLPAIGKGEPIEKRRAPLTNDARRKVLLSCEGQALAYLRKHVDNLVYMAITEAI